MKEGKVCGVVMVLDAAARRTFHIIVWSLVGNPLRIL